MFWFPFQLKFKVDSDFNGGSTDSFDPEAQAKRINRQDPLDVAYEDHTGILYIFIFPQILREHMMFIQRRLNVDATSWRCIDVGVMLYIRHVPGGLGTFFFQYLS